MSDEQMRAALLPCSGCGVESELVCRLIGDIDICPDCIYVMMGVVETSRPDLAKWQAAAQRYQPLVKALLTIANDPYKYGQRIQKMKTIAKQALATIEQGGVK